MIIKTYNIQLLENLMYLGYIHSNIESTTWKPNVLRVTFTQTWKITSMGKFSFYEHLSSSHWPKSEQTFIPNSKSCTHVLSFPMAEPINALSWFPISMGCHMWCRQSSHSQLYKKKIDFPFSKVVPWVDVIHPHVEK
jgi:hypothetical protein